MKENKYFTPAISDIYIGYECEIEELLKPDNNPNDPNGKHWKKVTIKTISNLGDIFNGESVEGLENRDKVYVRNTFRVAYLTAEQIEADGWTPFDLSKGFSYRRGVPSFRHGFTKGNYFVVLDTRQYHIEIGALDVLKIDFLPEFPETFRVTIPCKCINQFRYITRNLLNIK